MIEKYYQNKLLKNVLVIGVVIGIATAIARIGLSFFGAFAGISVVGGGLSEESANEFMAGVVVVVDVAAPYLMSLGILSIFLYVFLFPDKESRFTLLFWGMLMSTYLLGLIFYPSL